jgi:hypothetical protein
MKALLALTALLLLPASAARLEGRVGKETNGPGLLRFDVLEIHAAPGASSVPVQVDRTGGNQGAVSVKYVVVAGTAVAGTDFTPASGVLSWADGDGAAKIITVSVAPTANSAGKTVMLGLYDAAGGATTDPATRYAKIILAGGGGGGGGAGLLRFDVLEIHAAPGATSVTVQVDRTGGSTGAVSVKYGSTAGTATTGVDYTQASGVLTWADGDAAAKTFEVAVAPTANSAGKTVMLALFDPAGGATTNTQYAKLILAGTGGSGGGGEAGLLRFDVLELHASPGAASVTVQVDRTGGSTGAVSVKYIVAAGTAAAGTDFTPATGVLTWGDGDPAARSFNVAVAPTANSAGKTVMLALFDPAGGATTDPATRYAKIILAGSGNGGGHAGFVGFDEHDYVALAAAGKAVITVERGDGSSGAVAVSYSTLNGTALAGTDYTAVSGTLSWNDGEEGLKTFFVPLLANGVGTVKLLLGNPQGGVAIAQEHGTALLAITGSGHGGGGGAGTIQFTEEYFQVVAGKTATVTVERSGGHAGAVSVQYATGDGSGVAGTDYTPASGTLTWGPDEQGRKTFTVDTFANGKGGKSVHLALSNPTGGATLGGHKTASLYVLGTGGDTSACADDDTTLCVADNRFKIRVTWRTGQGQTGPGHVAKLNANAGAFWFFSADNTEMLVKVLDACNPFNSFWVFYAATTNVGFSVEVTDTHTGLVKTYSNPYGLAAPSVNDTTTFATCGQ